MGLLAFLTPANIATYLIAINFLAFAAFGIDKMLAEANSRRISEAALLQLAFIGGTPGAYAGRQMFRHKTQKQPFSENLLGVAVFQGLAFAALAGWYYFGSAIRIAPARAVSVHSGS